MAGNNIIVVFDFDKTIIECDSDYWVVQQMGATKLFHQLLFTIPYFNTIMRKMMKKLHKQGKSIDEIVEVLKQIPIHPRVIPAIKAAHALGCDLRIISDANMFSIETMLKHFGVREYFSEINTNPSFVDEKGTLIIEPFHNFRNSSHGCTTNTCSPNMCKGLVIERIKACDEGKNKRIIYVGDGRNDYCPSLKLKENDFAMPKKNFPLWDLICSNPLLIKAKIHEWSNGDEFEKVLLRLINSICSGDDIKSVLSSADFIKPNHQVVPVSRYRWDKDPWSSDDD
ncbi:hypothetical protein F8388_011449 [Cannabis sativa]|uniref:Uncharacterized protein n=1 Tax=Cannabis sativa TaxID=3483 RepID=A0A7J6HBQ6_CANSA|nr:hypothetical protein G4B88_015256 [Cannabis sativa]KAF4377696.1 hypothetical protein F8388_011449 [Cannabis sativa]KAF4392672.1 hypothetical protein G4B88_029411 [Cannabis sativa]